MFVSKDSFRKTLDMVNIKFKNKEELKNFLSNNRSDIHIKYFDYILKLINKYKIYYCKIKYNDQIQFFIFIDNNKVCRFYNYINDKDFIYVDFSNTILNFSSYYLKWDADNNIITFYPVFQLEGIINEK